jgi:ADP-ribosylglycohydrolase
MALDKEDAILGCLLGAAVGDALGLPMEGLSKRRQRKMYPDISGYHFLFGKGMVSDDTEHLCMVAQALAKSEGDEVLFKKKLAWALRKWLICLPPGVGFATLKSSLKLWVGFPAEKSGVFSAGNGPAMRSAILGVCSGEDTERLSTLVRTSTRITHTDPKAEYGAMAVALAAHMAANHEEDSGNYLECLTDLLGAEADEFLMLARKAADSAANGHSVGRFAAELGIERGVSGYMYHTVPIVLHAWFCYPEDFWAGINEAIRCGGDTDSVASMLGGIIGARVGKEGIPREMITNLRGWPVTVRWVQLIGECLARVAAKEKTRGVPSFPFCRLFLRNLFFIPLVLFYGFRRLLPPY